MEVGPVRTLRRINNNVVLCLDSKGREVIAIGRGIGFGDLPDDIPLSSIERSFYEVDARYLDGIANCPPEILSFAVSLSDQAAEELKYELSPNLPFTLADHISFAIERTKKGIHVSMPLAFDIEQSFPSKCRIGRHAVRAIKKKFGVILDDDEVAGIAMNFINSRLAPKEGSTSELANSEREMLEDITEIVEDVFDTTIDRSTFGYARFTTHLGYLFQRIHAGTSLSSSELEAFEGVRDKFPRGVECVTKIAAHIKETWGFEISEAEELYLLVHLSRIV